jgi:cell division septum initiation protein DivIVA
MTIIRSQEELQQMLDDAKNALALCRVEIQSLTVENQDLRKRLIATEERLRGFTEDSSRSGREAWSPAPEH